MISYSFMECEDIGNNLLPNILTHYYMPHLINYSIVITIETIAPVVKYCTTCEQIYATSVNSKTLHYNRILLKFSISLNYWQIHK